jgi:RNA polymerase sigma-70 factor, ECF subfamily
MSNHSMSAQEQEATFRRWLEVHLGLMLKIVRGCAAPSDQDDLFQDVCLQIWQSIPAFRGEAKETTWIYRVAFNTALVWKRGETRRAAKHERFAQSSVVEHAIPGQSATCSDDERVQQLFTAIRQLPKLDASLALMHLDGLSYREMSEVLGITETHVGVKLNRIRKQLAALLKGDNDEL